ncbi:MAG: phosphohistidine phosphatase SixA [Isosphaeraceae bacterium]|nr:phosphohistidine phosphatase SixA [Isosphaeraceae bacterium]
MNTLILVRHGIAVERGTEGIDDDDRPLTALGRKRTALVARRLARLIGEPDVVLTSPLPRALQTAEVLRRELGLRDAVEQFDPLRPDHDPHLLAESLRERPELRIVAVGHEPTLSSLAALLVAGRADLPLIELAKAGAVGLRLEPEGGPRIDWLVRPRVVRAIADDRNPSRRKKF